MNKSITVEEIHDIDKAIEIIQKSSECQYLRFGEGVDAIRKYAEKQLQYGHFLAEYLDNKPVGYICFYSNDQETKRGYVSAFFVGGTGLMQGRLFFNLVEEAVRIGIMEGMTSLKVEVDKENLHARKLYEKMGFEYTGEEKEQSVYMFISIGVLVDRFNIGI